MILLSIFETTLPLTNPVLKFLLILVIILVAPILRNPAILEPIEKLDEIGKTIGKMFRR